MPDSPLYAALKPYAVIFAQKAGAGIAVDDAANYLVDEFYETLVPLVKKHVFAARFMSDSGLAEYAVNAAQDPEQIEKLFALAPELGPHREWALQVIAAAVKIVVSPQEEATSALPDEV